MAIIKTDVLDKSYFWVQWSQNSQSIENNSTTINWSCGFNPGRQYYLNAIKMNAVTIKTTADYMLSDRFQLRVYYDKVINQPFVGSFDTSNTNFGVSFRFTLAE